MLSRIVRFVRMIKTQLPDMWKHSQFSNSVFVVYSANNDKQTSEFETKALALAKRLNEKYDD